MIARLREILARREARAALAARRAGPLPAVADRRLLVVLPDDPEGVLSVADLLEALDLPASHVDLVHLGAPLASVPRALEGRVREIGPEGHDWRGLPSAAVRRELWGTRPDVALSLAAASDLAASLVVGGSPAGVRIGRHADDAEAFFDLLIGGEPDAAGASRALRRLLRALDPPVLPILPTC